MLVSWEWLSQYVSLKWTHEETALRLSMSGLNHEVSKVVGNDVLIDLEVTSNRADCLGHIGVAREIAILSEQPICVPSANVVATGPDIKSLLKVTNQFPQGSPRYTARVIQGVKVGPSPDWLVRRLATIGCKSINNIVDVTNYVMFECGQPLHAFDLKKIRGGEIIVRTAREGESIEAIDHRTYKLDPTMIVIADAERPVALAGVMGGADSEVGSQTVDVLIEAADFAPLMIRKTSRSLKLQSPSSFRFERKIDNAALDWASRRCCELILQVAGGKLCQGVIDSAAPPPPRGEITLRMKQISRVLGIEIDYATALRILSALGCEIRQQSNTAASEVIVVQPPTWRADLTREIDLIEELARIHGYDKIPEDAPVPMTTSAKRPKDVVLEHARQVMLAAGLDEALTPSVVTAELNQQVSPWSELAALQTDMPLLEGATYLRRSLVPSLIACRLYNQSLSNRDADLFEIANVYLAGAKSEDLPQEKSVLGLVVGTDFLSTKGLVETVVQRITGIAETDSIDWDYSGASAGNAIRLRVQGVEVAVIATLSTPNRKSLGLDQNVSFAEILLDALLPIARLVPTAAGVSTFPAITRDLNFVLDESLRWDRLSQVVRAAGGEFLRQLQYRETYRDTQKDGEGKKRVLLSFALQSDTRTLTSQEADQFTQQIIDACQRELGGRLFV